MKDKLRQIIKNCIVIILFIIGFYLMVIMLGSAWDSEYEYQQLKEQQDIRAIEENKSM